MRRKMQMAEPHDRNTTPFASDSVLLCLLSTIHRSVGSTYKHRCFTDPLSYALLYTSTVALRIT